MKLTGFKHRYDYVFHLEFHNGEVVTADLRDLIGKHVPLDELSSARLDADWGCLEFRGGLVDIEPKTLYHHALSHPAPDLSGEKASKMAA